MNQDSKKRWIWIGVILVIAIVVAIFASQLAKRGVLSPAETPAPPAAAPTLAPTEEAGLGATLYKEITPAEKLPATNPFTETPNPLEDVYQNPFGE